MRTSRRPTRSRFGDDVRRACQSCAFARRTTWRSRPAKPRAVCSAELSSVSTRGFRGLRTPPIWTSSSDAVDVFATGIRCCTRQIPEPAIMSDELDVVADARGDRVNDEVVQMARGR